MYKKILVPLDGSRRAEAILPHVIEIAQNQGSILVLLTVVEPMLSTISPYSTQVSFDADAFDKQTETTRAYIDNLAQDLEARGVATIQSIEHGPIVRTIIDAAKHENVDLVAVASHGRTGMSRALYGSVAAALLYQIERPLLIIRTMEAAQNWFQRSTTG